LLEAEMPLEEVLDQAWRRKHDDPATAVVPRAPSTIYAKSLEDLIEICRIPDPRARFHAAGSHWGLSTAAISDRIFVETHDPGNRHQAMGKTLFEVVPKCLNPAFIAWLAQRRVKPFDEDEANVAVNEGLYPVHIETGKRVYQLYAELDTGDDANLQSLALLLSRPPHNNPSYLGPWAFPTLGGAGGQTVFGALHTGTHGGDFRMPPMADAVMAIHLVSDGGKHYWIEPETPSRGHPRLTDDASLKALYGPRSASPDDFQIRRDDRLFRAVLISAGRFGIVYSVVLAAVRQYCLHQERRLSTWRAVKGQIADPNSALYSKMVDGREVNRFLQVAVGLTPVNNFKDNLVGITKRWNVPKSTPLGRDQRVGRVEMRFDPRLQAPRYSNAGRTQTFIPDPTSPDMAKDPGFLERACTNADFTSGVIASLEKEIEEFVESNGAVVGAIMGVAASMVGPGGLLLLIEALKALLSLLKRLVRDLASPAPRLGDAVNIMREVLLNQPTPETRAAGLFLFQSIAAELFRLQQDESDFEAISYAVMDGHDYLDRSCNVNVDSIELFFDATDPMLPAYIDPLIAFEVVQEVTRGLAFAGYASLRFMGQGNALLGQARWPVTCSVEVAGLLDTRGTKELIDFASALALNPSFGAIPHWGQRNDARQADIERLFGGEQDVIGMWRGALSQITRNGRLDRFSNAFTRQTGLEIVEPRIGTLTATRAGPGQPIVADWSCEDNPLDTAVRVEFIAPSGARQQRTGLRLSGREQLLPSETGQHEIRLTLSLQRGSLRSVHRTNRVLVT
jgi:hypothetical protein